MPAETIAAPPAPAPAAPAGEVGSAVPQSTGEIKVTPESIEKEAAPPPKPGTPKSDLFSKLDKMAGHEPDPTVKVPEEKIKPAVTSKGEKKEAPAETPPADPKAAADPKGKVNPWKLVEDYKKKHAAAEAALAETKKLIKDEAAARAEAERLTKAEARAKELEDHIRYVDYSKSQEFAEKYQKPYETAWKAAMSELKEIVVSDPNTGAERPFAPQDLLALVNMPLNKAREIANEMFGDYADDIMAQRKEVRGLFDKQVEALEDARKNGAEREKTTRAEQERTMGEITKHITEQWKQLNEGITKDEKIGKYFQPIEGDDEANSRLAKGYELVDSAFNTDPMNPKLTPEEREAVIKKHVAVRNRAAAFGRLVHLLEKEQAEKAAMAEELKQYRESTPNLAGTRPATPPPGGEGSGIDGLMGRLEKFAAGGRS